MILWQDFILDHELGPILNCGEPQAPDASASSMMDAAGITSQIQETGQEQRPARMAGFSSLDLPETGRSGQDAPVPSPERSSLRLRGNG